jgi:hypothetical protein
VLAGVPDVGSAGNGWVAAGWLVNGGGVAGGVLNGWVVAGWLVNGGGVAGGVLNGWVVAGAGGAEAGWPGYAPGTP